MDQNNVRDVARTAAGNTSTFLRKQIDDRSSAFGEEIINTAHDLRTIGEKLEDAGPAGKRAASLATWSAQHIDGIGGYLKTANTEQLIADFETFTREKPWAVAAGAMTLGLLASRMLKSSSVQRYRSAYDV